MEEKSLESLSARSMRPSIAAVVRAEAMGHSGAL